MMFSAVTFSVTLGMAGLGFDASYWYMAKREIQTVADASVLSGVSVLTKGGTIADAQQAIVDEAARNGFVDTVDGDVTANVPPLFGPNAGDPNFVEVIVDRPIPLFLTSLSNNASVVIQSRAVGAVTANGEHCLLALDHKADEALLFSGTADVNLSCGVASNSSSDRAILVNGNAYLHADPAQAFGDIMVSGSGTLDTETPPQPLSERVPDPYASLEWPSPSTCDQNNYVAQNETISPGVYCGGLTMKQTVTLLPGVYIIHEGDLSANANAAVTGTDVTFIFTGNDPEDVGSINKINGGADMTLSAPGPAGHAAGPYAGKYGGVLFMQQPDAENGAVNKINGGADMEFSGALYFPNQEVDYTGGASDSVGCVKIIARQVTFTGSSYLNSDPVTCAAQGVATMAQVRIRLVE